MKTVDELKVECRNMLGHNGVKAKSKRGKDMIYAFWVGALYVTGKAWPFVLLCLMSGRYDELVAKEES